MIRRRLSIAFGMLCLLTVHTGLAHEIWLEWQGKDLVLLYGHGGAGHAGAERIEYAVEEVTEVLCFDVSGVAVEPEVERVYPVRIDAECAVTCVLTSSGYWSKTPFGTKRLPKDEAKSPLRSWLSFEGVKRIDAWNAELARPLTAHLELVPLNDPLSLEEGDKLRLLVCLEGRPVEGVVVAYDGKPRGRTGEDGKINIRIRRGGLQMIQASHTVPVTSEKADEVIHAATLNFEVE